MGVVAIALLIKTIILFQLADHPLLHEDSGLDTTAYAELARRVVAGDLLLGPGLYYLSPLYIYVLAAGLALTDSFTAVRGLQILAGAMSVGGIWWMTLSWSTTRAAWWAAGLATAAGILTFYEVLILQASIDTALTTAALATLTLALRGGAPGWFAASGVAFGIAALNRPNMTAVVIGFLALLIVTRRVKPALWMLAGTLVAFAPVAIRNGVVAGEWMTVSSHGGLNFHIGNGEGATGFYRQVPGITPSIVGQAHDARQVAGRAMGRPVTDAEASDYFVDQSLRWMRDNPGTAITLFGKKLFYVFHASYIALPHSYPFYVHDTGAWLRWMPVGPWLLMPLGLVGLGLLAARSDNRLEALTWVAFVPMYAMAVALFFVADRYRLPLLVPMCVGSGIALDAMTTALRARAWRSMVMPIGAGLILAALVNAPANLNEGRWTEGLRLAQRLVILGRDEEAAAWVDRLTRTAPEPGGAQALVGRQYLVEGKPDRALPYLRAAVDAGARSPQALADLASAFERTGDIPNATATLDAITPGPGEGPDFWLRLGRQAATLKAPDLAGRFFAHAVAQAPDDGDARLQFGVNLVVRNLIPEAAEQLRVAVARNPRQPDALAYLAFCEIALGDIEAGRRHAETALLIDPNHRVAQSVLAAIR